MILASQSARQLPQRNTRELILSRPAATDRPVDKAGTRTPDGSRSYFLSQLQKRDKHLGELFLGIVLLPRASSRFETAKLLVGLNATEPRPTVVTIPRANYPDIALS